MKKIFYSVILIFILTLFCTNVGAEQFGDVFFEYDDGIRVFLSGGQGTPDSFGVALSDGDKILHIYHIGSDFEKPFSFVFHGFSDKEIEVRQFVSNDGVFSYGLPFYVTYDGKLNVISLNEIKESVKSDLENLIDKSLYRLEEQAIIDSVIEEARFKIDRYTRRYGIESVVEETSIKFSALKTDAEYKAEELTEKRVSAINEITNYVNKTDYRAEEQAEIDSIISNATIEINTTEDFAVIDSLVESAKASISTLKTNTEYKAEELVAKRISAIDEINNYVNKADYRTEEQNQIDSIILNANSEINSTEDFDAIDLVIANAKVQLLALKTDAEYKAEELAAKRASAIDEINNYVDKSNYRDNEQTQLENIITNAVFAINSATEIAEIDSIIATAKVSISALKTDAEYKVEELAAKRTSAIDEINNYAYKNNYRDDEQTQLENIITNAVFAINSATEIAEIDSIIATAKVSISTLKTDAEYKAEELVAKRISAINEITNFVDKSNYRTNEQNQIDSIILNANSEINSTEDFDAIDLVIANAKVQLLALKTDSEYKAEELTAKRASAIYEIHNYVNKADYRTEEQAQIDSIISDATIEINTTEEFSVIDSVVASVKNQISALKTDAEYKVEELAAKRTSAIDEINNYVNKADYRAEEQAQIDSIISNTTTEINATEDFVEIDSVVEKAKASLSTLKTDAEYEAEELAAKRISAINEITNFVDKSNYRENEQNQIERIIAEATLEIDSTEDFTAIDSVVENAKESLSMLKTDAEYKAEELTAKRASAIDEINNYVDKSNYRDNEQTQLENIITNAVFAINSATEIAEIDSIIATAKVSISTLKTDAEYKVEELAAKRASAIDEINNYVNKADYRTEEQNQIDSIISNTTTEINATEDFDAIDLVIVNAKVQLSALKTDAEYKAEELAVKRTSAIDDITYFVDKSAYREQEQAQINTIISNAITRINISEDIDEIDSVVASAKNQISALKTDAELTEEELLSSKSEAEAEITGFVDLAEYRESEAELITEIITKYTLLINSAETEDEINIYLETAKSEMSAVLTDSQLKDNADANAIVLTNLNDAITQLGKIRFFGNEKKIMNIILPVMKQVVADGTYGSILITPEYVEKTYASQIAEVKSLYDSMDETIEKPGFEAKLAKMDPATQAFLKEYFL